jgi:RNA polymerase sigma-70 factor (ECF subfamily)
VGEPNPGAAAAPDRKEGPHGHGAPDEAELVERARHDDPLAIDQLLRRYQRKVYGIAYQLCGFDRDEAEDSAQEALLQIFRNIKRFEGRSRFSTWLHRVAVNSCLDTRRRRRRLTQIIFPWRAERPEDPDSRTALERLPDPQEGGDALSQVGGRQLRRDLLQVLKSLSEKQRTVFELKVLQEMSIAEIAEVTGMAEGTVKTHLFRATQAVRARLNRWVQAESGKESAHAGMPQP